MSAELASSVGLLVAAAGACAAMLMAPSRRRSVLMILTLALLPVLVLGDQWNTPRIEALRDSPGTVLLGGAVALAAVGAGVVAFRRLPAAMPLALVAALPFRVPLQAGGDQANLLVPLYLVLAAAVLAAALSTDAQGHRPAGRPAAWLRLLLPAVVGLYAIQALYSADGSAALQDVCFFLVPFSLVFVLIREVAWTPRLLAALLGVVVVEALVFTLFGYWEYLTRTLIWNPEVIRANDFHIYFRVNSLFWDPNMYGRFLVLAILGLTAALMWTGEGRRAWLFAGLIVILWLGLATTFSLSSFAALLAGLAVLAALRWSLRWTAAAAGVCLLAVVALAITGSDLFDEETSLNNRTSGRGDLVTGGLELFGQRPLHGFGSASFSTVFLERIADGRAPVSESHTEPITVAVEQGALGLALYLALIGAALATMWGGLRRWAPGLGGSAPPDAFTVARIAVLAAFAALLVHTLSYAGFLEDPATWVLLALASALALRGAQGGKPGRAKGDTAISVDTAVGNASG